MVAPLTLVLVVPVGLAAAAVVAMLVVRVRWVREVMVGLRLVTVVVVLDPAVVALCQ